MEATVKLFYEDSHMEEFDAAVCACLPYGDKYKVVLDRRPVCGQRGAWRRKGV